MNGRAVDVPLRLRHRQREDGKPDYAPPRVTFGAGWYHEEAIREAERLRRF